VDWDIVIESFPKIWKGAGTTLSLFAWSLLFGTAGALGLALMRLSSVAAFRWFAGIFGWLFRGIPLLILLFYAFFALPELRAGGLDGIVLPPFSAAVLALSLWTAAYQAEVIRSGILAVEPGQAEAAEALGMTKPHYTRRIIIPQGIRIMLPPYFGNAMTLLKQTSLATLVTVPEMTLLTQRIFSNNFKFVEPIAALALLYLAMTTVLVFAQVGLERAFRLKV
jgi:polar amino acid transport system permease protein/cystine transport system permease protein